ncbi:BON domain-containing protein [Oryzifoliimicrobium ureilyticus]|uniref:BON domain-containing protein n=1 Tax=Oryzifoliimicrobium ureilyticus TaxID=3113724 RepID=UPI0030760963
MFSILTSTTRSVASKLAETAETIATTLAYSDGLENSSIRVREMAGMVFLEGTASSPRAIDRATEIAVSIAGPCVCNRIEPA